MQEKIPNDAAARPLFTIGHSNHPTAHFLALLARHRVEVVADVRSRPYSRFVPQYRKEALAGILADADIGYLFLGAELGGKPPRGEVAARASTTPRASASPPFRTASRSCWRPCGRRASLCFAASATRSSATGCT